METTVSVNSAGTGEFLINLIVSAQYVLLALSSRVINVFPRKRLTRAGMELMCKPKRNVFPDPNSSVTMGPLFKLLTIVCFKTHHRSQSLRVQINLSSLMPQLIYRKTSLRKLVSQSTSYGTTNKFRIQNLSFRSTFCKKVDPSLR